MRALHGSRRAGSPFRPPRPLPLRRPERHGGDPCDFDGARSRLAATRAARGGPPGKGAPGVLRRKAAPLDPSPRLASRFSSSHSRRHLSGQASLPSHRSKTACGTRWESQEVRQRWNRGRDREVWEPGERDARRPSRAGGLEPDTSMNSVRQKRSSRPAGVPTT
jgi:hypothetical protein